MNQTRQMTWQERYMNKFYRSEPGWIDGTTEFWDMVRQQLGGSNSILELGCGPTNVTSHFLKGLTKELHGMDVDPEASENEDVDEFFLYDGRDWPVESNRYDGVVSDYVLEHVGEAETFAREVGRVLKPGGVFLFRTPNMWHYVTLISRFTPQWFHVLVSQRARTVQGQYHEPYPTFYRMNRRSDVRKLMSNAGLHEVELRMVEKEPSYGLASRLLFVPFMAYERLVNSTSALEAMRSNIMAIYQKPLS